MSTNQIAFKMKIKPGHAAEYKRRHDEIWPELLDLLKQQNISDYSIYLDEETSILFAVQNIGSTTSSSNQSLKDNPIMKKWWIYMADIMETNSDSSPISEPLKLVFHMD
ncbi:unnamed protein product [Didymodactylos carnosus]|uniref:L-rhamnose mutarotase n=1 Tax=Didymodactylos carnosus TaxID=1234261 RepID=A0A8S2GQ18_9BILA|nr:unnamed protein product [Didymodactylos carnosus]CAF3545618.1 unnamed protein product [Didymodactylos carnosus]